MKKNHSNKAIEPKFPPRITVELETKEQRDRAARAVRKLGYMTLSDFVREKLDEAVRQSEAVPA